MAHCEGEARASDSVPHGKVPLIKLYLASAWLSSSLLSKKSVRAKSSGSKRTESRRTPTRHRSSCTWLQRKAVDCNAAFFARFCENLLSRASTSVLQAQTSDSEQNGMGKYLWTMALIASFFPCRTAMKARSLAKLRNSRARCQGMKGNQAVDA